WPAAVVGALAAVAGTVVLPAGTARLRRGAPAALAAMTLFGAGYGGADSLITILLTHEYGVGLARAATVLSAAPIAWALTSLAVTRTAPERQVPAAGLALTAAAAAVLAAGPREFVVALVVWTVGGAGVGLAYPGLYLRATTQPPALPAPAAAQRREADGGTDSAAGGLRSDPRADPQHAEKRPGPAGRTQQTAGGLRSARTADLEHTGRRPGPAGRPHQTAGGLRPNPTADPQHAEKRPGPAGRTQQTAGGLRSDRTADLERTGSSTGPAGTTGPAERARREAQAAEAATAVITAEAVGGLLGRAGGGALASLDGGAPLAYGVFAVLLALGALAATRSRAPSPTR
ncbi:hypothetical protein DY240_07630, partial [Jiangella rhizosphaerae]